MFVIYLAGFILLVSLYDVGGQTTSDGIDFRMANPEQLELMKKCDAECGGDEAYEETKRSGLFACFTIEENPEDGIPSFKTADSPCTRQCMEGGKPDDDQLNCFFEMCSEWKTNPESYNWIFFCPSYAQKHIEKNECDLVLSGKVRYYGNCTEA